MGMTETAKPSPRSSSRGAASCGESEKERGRRGRRSGQKIVSMNADLSLSWSGGLCLRCLCRERLLGCGRCLVNATTQTWRRHGLDHGDRQAQAQRRSFWVREAEGSRCAAGAGHGVAVECAPETWSTARVVPQMLHAPALGIDAGRAPISRGPPRVRVWELMTPTIAAPKRNLHDPNIFTIVAME